MCEQLAYTGLRGVEGWGKGGVGGGGVWVLQLPGCVCVCFLLGSEGGTRIVRATEQISSSIVAGMH